MVADNHEQPFEICLEQAVFEVSLFASFVCVREFHVTIILSPKAPYIPKRIYFIFLANSQIIFEIFFCVPVLQALSWQPRLAGRRISADIPLSDKSRIGSTLIVAASQLQKLRSDFFSIMARDSSSPE